MLNIVVFCGGTGSIALQKGLARVFERDRYHLDVIINAYDNGKSTGMCRRACHNKILGPSDLRKNQLTEFAIRHAEDVQDASSISARLLDLFSIRIDAESPEEYWAKASRLILNADFLEAGTRSLLLEHAERFLLNDVERLRKESFHDVALSNIFYAQCAYENGCSIGRAGDIIADILGLEHNIHLASDVSLILKARTSSGHVIEDEGEIVDWNDRKDRIEEIFFIDPATGLERTPILDEGNERSRVHDVLEKADVILFSSGTQWSSLIPTYVHYGFQKAIEKSKARKYLVMNNIQDRDMLGLGAEDVLHVLDCHLPLKDITLVFNSNAAEEMQAPESWTGRKIIGDLSEKGTKTHDPERLVECIFKDFFGLNPERTMLTADLDGTMIESRGNAEARRLGQENVKLFNGTILTGNTEEHVRSNVDFHDGLSIYCDYGMREVLEMESRSIVDQDWMIDPLLMKMLEENPHFKGRIRSRNGLALTIKPLTERRRRLQEINEVLERFHGRFKARIAGSTSIDVLPVQCSKMTTLMKIAERRQISLNHVLYIGNELLNEEGNDWCIARMGVQTFNVRGIEEFNNLIRIWTRLGKKSSEGLTLV